MFVSAGGIDRSEGDSALIVHVQYGENQKKKKDLQLGSAQLSSAQLSSAQLRVNSSWLPVKIQRWLF